MDGTTGAVVLINLFEVPAAADQAFVAGWERARDFLRDQDGYLATELHRSLTADADFRFVNVAHWRSPAAFQAALSRPGNSGRELPFPAHPALYQVIREDEPPRDDPGGVVLINAFEVPADGDDTFLAGWERTRDVLRGQPGYLATRLHRSLSPATEFRFVNLGRYQSPQAFQAAVRHADFQRAAASIPYRAHPSLYEVIRR